MSEKEEKLVMSAKLTSKLFSAGAFIFSFVLTAFLIHMPALAGDAASVNNLAQNVVESSAELPGLIAAFSYLIGLILGITGVLKLKEHAENPNQAPLRSGVIRLIIGGALFALPMIYDAAAHTIGDDGLNIDPATTVGFFLSEFAGMVTIVNINSLIDQFSSSADELPGLIAAVSYLLGLVITVIGVLKIKDHVENPDQTALKEGVVRLLAGGALLSIPTIYNAMFGLFDLDDISVAISGIFQGAGFFVSGYAQDFCVPGAGIANNILGFFGLGDGPTLGNLICDIVVHTGAIPAFLAGISYLLGLILGIWGVLKLRDHALNPQQVGLWEGLSRLIAGGAFFALPVVVEVLHHSLSPVSLMASAAVPVTGFNGGDCGSLLDFLPFPIPGLDDAGAVGLDCMLSNFMSDVMAPIHIVLNFFCFVAGIIFIMIGVSRLIKSAQDGARGPGGIGTIMTFIIGSALLSYNEIIRAVTTSLFDNPLTYTYGTLSYADGMGDAEAASAHMVISAIIKFVIVVGLVSFVRGLFIIRSVAEGNQQASIMAGITHIIAGAVAVNLGPLINAVQSTLGIETFGIMFT